MGKYSLSCQVQFLAQCVKFVLLHGATSEAVFLSNCCFISQKDRAVQKRWLQGTLIIVIKLRTAKTAKDLSCCFWIIWFHWDESFLYSANKSLVICTGHADLDLSFLYSTDCAFWTRTQYSLELRTPKEINHCIFLRKLLCSLYWRCFLEGNSRSTITDKPR